MRRNHGRSIEFLSITKSNPDQNNYYCVIGGYAAEEEGTLCGGQVKLTSR